MAPSSASPSRTAPPGRTSGPPGPAAARRRRRPRGCLHWPSLPPRSFRSRGPHGPHLEVVVAFEALGLEARHQQGVAPGPAPALVAVTGDLLPVVVLHQHGPVLPRSVGD